MKKLTLCVLLFGALALIGCKSKTGRQNIQYVRPAEDSVRANDLNEVEDTGYVIMEDVDTAEEDAGIEVGDIPTEGDFDELRSNETKREMEQILMGQ